MPGPVSGKMFCAVSIHPDGSAILWGDRTGKVHDELNPDGWSELGFDTPNVSLGYHRGFIEIYEPEEFEKLLAGNQATKIFEAEVNVTGSTHAYSMIPCPVPLTGNVYGLRYEIFTNGVQTEDPPGSGNWVVDLESTVGYLSTDHWIANPAAVDRLIAEKTGKVYQNYNDQNVQFLIKAMVMRGLAVQLIASGDWRKYKDVIRDAEITLSLIKP